LLEVLLGPEGRRRLILRNLPNAELARLYDSELVLKLHKPKNLRDTRTVLSHFMSHLGAYPPSPELARSFLAQYANRKPRTLYRYAQMIKGFMKWYGEPMADPKVKIPKTLPPYTEDSEIGKLFEPIESKQTHKKSIVRDSLLVALGLKSGMRRSELANLETQDVHADFLGTTKEEREMDMNRIEILRNYIDEVLLNMTDVVERRCAYVHPYGVAQSCALIALKRGENVELAVMAGMLHDIYSYARMDTSDHAHKGATLAREILEELQITSKVEIGIICDAIYSHSDKELTHSAFDEVLKDADTLQYWLYNPLVELLNQPRKERCTRMMVEFDITRDTNVLE